MASVRVPKRAEDSIDGRRRVGGLDEHQELVAADAGGDVHVAHRAEHAPRRLLQKVVAEQMPVAVVRAFEEVQVEQHEHEVFPRSRFVERVLHGAFGGLAVEQAGERVGACLPDEPIQVHPLFVDVHAFSDESR